MIVVLTLLGVSFFYAVVESLGYMPAIGQTGVSLDAYRAVLAFDSEFWAALGFSLWISLASTAISAGLALALAVWLSEHNHHADTLALNWNLAFPHLVWAAATPTVAGGACAGEGESGRRRRTTRQANHRPR